MKRTLLSFVSLFALSSAAAAADISGLLERADKAAAEGRHAEAIAALAQALEAVRKEAPMAIEPFMLVSRPAKSFGDYAPRASTVFSDKDELLFYMEPKNLVYGSMGKGTYVPSFEVDLYVLDASGESIAAQEKFGSFRLPSQSPVQDIFLNLNVTLTGAPAGDYTIRFVVRDLNSDKRATVEKTITMR